MISPTGITRNLVPLLKHGSQGVLVVIRFAGRLGDAVNETVKSDIKCMSME